jgi:N-acetyl-anhydromuramyl-L-alanine amidase AmpD
MSVPPLNVRFIAARWHGGAQKPVAVVIHGTVSPCDTGRARKVAADFAGTATKKSAHYTVDPGETVQSVADHVVAYHCGHNTGSIAFELCDPQTGSGKRWSDKAHQAMLDRAARDVAQTCLAYDIEMTHVSVASLKAKGPHGIYDHNASRLAFGETTHTDVGPDFPWESFMADVRRYATELRTGRQEPTVADTPTQQTKAKILAAVQFGKGEIPAARKAQHKILDGIAALAKKMK